MDRQSAEKIALLLEEAISNVGQALHVALEAWPARDTDLFRLQCADIVADISIRLLDPVYACYPDLEPEALKAGEDMSVDREAQAK